MHRVKLCLFICLFLTACTVGIVNREVLTPDTSILPTPETVASLVPTTVLQPTIPSMTLTPTPPPYIGNTPIPADQMQGEWRKFTTADGLCTDWPLFIGRWYIGTGTTKICTLPRSIDEPSWATIDIPQGTRVTAAVKFPPGGGLGIATDIGVCGDRSWATEERPNGPVWECVTAEEGVPTGIRGMVSLVDKPVYMLTNTVIY